MYCIVSFAKRSTKLTYRAVDEFSYNEMLEQKRAEHDYEMGREPYYKNSNACYSYGSW